MFGYTPPESNSPDTIAAVDLGSNSFHMIVARVENGQIQVIDRLREMVRLGAGLDEEKRIRSDTAARALDCLERFGQRLRSLNSDSVAAVGTNTLRQVSESDGFLASAERALGHSIEVISGREEARLVYLGVAHGLGAEEGRRLVVDIGGGSTELIIGEGFEPLERESMHMGCVSYSHRWFPDGRIDEDAMSSAVTAGRVELRPVKAAFSSASWGQAVGSSGTIKSIRDVVTTAGWSEEGITRASLKKLREALIGFGSVDAISLEGVSDERKPVFAGGVAVLSAVFKSLDIERMQVSDTALREGLLYEMLGQINHTEDVRERTVATLAGRYAVDLEQARRVEMTASALLAQVAKSWRLAGQEYSAMLSWACRLHEVGITVSHSGFHKHGAYLVANSDLPGFSRRQQQVLAALIRAHRRKFPQDVFDQLPEGIRLCVSQLAVLLRLAVLLHRGRSRTSKPMVLVEVDGANISLHFPDRWLERHPLTRAELAEEARRLAGGGFNLEYL